MINIAPTTITFQICTHHHSIHPITLIIVQDRFPIFYNANFTYICCSKCEGIYESPAKGGMY